MPVTRIFLVDRNMADLDGKLDQIFNGPSDAFFPPYEYTEGDQTMTLRYFDLKIGPLDEQTNHYPNSELQTDVFDIARVREGQNHGDYDIVVFNNIPEN